MILITGPCGLHPAHIVIFKVTATIINVDSFINSLVRPGTSLLYYLHHHFFGGCERVDEASEGYSKSSLNLSKTVTMEYILSKVTELQTKI